MEDLHPVKPFFEVEFGASYQKLHQLANQYKPGVEIHDGEYIVAILLPNKSTVSPKPEDFFWLKVREKRKHPSFYGQIYPITKVMVIL